MLFLASEDERGWLKAGNRTSGGRTESFGWRRMKEDVVVDDEVSTASYTFHILVEVVELDDTIVVHRRM
jgi:hypothetical protein